MKITKEMFEAVRAAVLGNCSSYRDEWYTTEYDMVESAFDATEQNLFATENKEAEEREELCRLLAKYGDPR